MYLYYEFFYTHKCTHKKLGENCSDLLARSYVSTTSIAGNSFWDQCLAVEKIAEHKVDEVAMPVRMHAGMPSLKMFCINVLPHISSDLDVA